MNGQSVMHSSCMNRAISLPHAVLPAYGRFGTHVCHLSHVHVTSECVALCSFCKQHFYDQTAMFKHMEQHHYHCHLCRRENPDNYIYFKDYQHLEEHFEQKHFLCPFEECRQLKFVVFSTEAELRKHMMAEHAGENSMNNLKRHERRAALTLETGFMAAPRVRVANSFYWHHLHAALILFIMIVVLLL